MHDPFWDAYLALTDSVILTRGSLLQLEGTILMGVCVLILNAANYETFWEYLETIDWVDQAMNKHFHVKFDYPFFLRNSIIIGVVTSVIIWTLLLFTLIMYTRVTTVNSISIYCSYTIANIPYYALISEFTLFCFILARRFNHLNAVLMQLIPGDNTEEHTVLLTDDCVYQINYKEINDIYDNEKRMVSYKTKNVFTVSHGSGGSVFDHGVQIYPDVNNATIEKKHALKW